MFPERGILIKSTFHTTQKYHVASEHYEVHIAYISLNYQFSETWVLRSDFISILFEHSLKPFVAADVFLSVNFFIYFIFMLRQFSSFASSRFSG